MSRSVETVKTPEGRVSFPKVFEKSDYSGKFELTLVFPKGTDLSMLKALATKAVREKWSNKIPAGLKSPFRKCGEKPETYGEQFDPDDIFIGFRSSTRQPGIVDASVQPIIEQSEFYPGCWARVSTNAYAYDKKGNKGVAFGLINIQKVRDDDPLAASAVRAEDDFDPLEGSSEDPAAFGTDDDIFGNEAPIDTGVEDDTPF